MIINSLLDTDLYKLTMMQVIFHHFPETVVEYEFKCRTPNVDLLPFAETIKKEIDHFCALQFNQEELAYLRTLSFFKDDFIRYLGSFKFNCKHIIFNSTGPFGVTIRGPWLETILFEVPLLAIISEVHACNKCPDCDYTIARKRLAEKISLIKASSLLNKFLFSDFGTRRRFSFFWHDELISIVAKELPNNFCGTSNILFAKKYSVNPIGTMAHEYIQGCQALSPSLRESQKYAFNLWYKEYGSSLSIALSDTYNLKVFLKDFDFNLSKMFDGVRQDSGDPFKCGDLILEHYKNMRIDSKTKKIVFSDGLNFPLAIRLYNHFKEHINPIFGIGTNLTNDLEYTPIQIVIKMTECNGQPVAKITDNPDKTACKDPSYLAQLKKIFEIS